MDEAAQRRSMCVDQFQAKGAAWATRTLGDGVCKAPERQACAGREHVGDVLVGEAIVHRRQGVAEASVPHVHLQGTHQ